MCGVRGVERLPDLRLQTRLLVKSDLEVREDRELHARFGVALESQSLIVHKRLTQIALPSGRVARSQSLEKPPERGGLGSRVRRALLEVAGELEPDLLEHLPISACDRSARKLERVKRSVQLGRQATDTRFALEEAAAQQAAPQRCNWMQQPPAFPEPAPNLVEQVLTADGPPRLSRGPGRVRAPVGAVAALCYKRRGEKRVAVRDLEVAEDRARDGDDPADVVRARRVRGSVRVESHTVSVSRHELLTRK